MPYWKLDAMLKELMKRVENKHHIIHGAASFCVRRNICFDSAYRAVRRFTLPTELYREYWKPSERSHWLLPKEKGLSLIDSAMPGISNKGEIFRDMVASYYEYGTLFGEYIAFNFYGKTDAARRTFITERDRAYYKNAFNDKRYDYLFLNKHETIHLFAPFMKRSTLRLNINKNQQEEFGDFLAKHGKAIIKPDNLGGGGRVRIVEKENIKDPARYYMSNLVGKDWVVEEVIIQHPETAKFHPWSVNTVRIPTILTKDGDAVIFDAIFRMGRNGSHVDNFSAGGYLAKIDVATGIVISNGFCSEGTTCIRHPNTNEVIPGFEIPQWKELVGIAREAALVVPQMRYISWDFALNQEKRWVLVEGNDCGQFDIYQVFSMFGLKERINRLV
jgi:hypothetical protein